MNKQVLESKIINENFEIRSIQISYSNSVREIGKQKVKKFLYFLKILYLLLGECIFQRPKLIYFQLSHLGIPFYRDLIFILFIKIFRIKIVYHLHGKGIKEKADQKFHRILYKFAFKNSEVICLSSLLVYDICDVFFGEIHIVNNGIQDIYEESIINSVKNAGEKKNSILFLSNLSVSKGILVFLESLKILSEKNIDFEAIIVGAESEIDSIFLIKIFKEYKLGNKVMYLGPRYGNEKNEILLKCDILVFPTMNDAWGNVILEAMSFAKPLIVTKEGAIPEIVENGTTGFIVDKNNPMQIAAKLEYLINNPKLRNEMGIAGRKKFAEKYTLQTFELNLNNVFEKVLNKGKGHAV